MTPHLNPLPPDQWDESLGPILERLGIPLNIHSIIAHHPALLQAWMPFRYHIIGGSSLTARQRELIILRTALLTDTDYEWQHHVVRGREAGLSDAEIAATTLDDPSQSPLAEDEQTLLAAVTQMVAKQKIDEFTCQHFLRHYDKTQLLDLIATVGGYLTLATMLKTFSVPLESDFVTESDLTLGTKKESP